MNSENPSIANYDIDIDLVNDGDNIYVNGQNKNFILNFKAKG